jgi:hypothetical protein
MEYKNAIKLVGVADGTFDYWAQEVKRATGREFPRCGLFPPSRYFIRSLVCENLRPMGR